MTTPAGWYDDGNGAQRYWDGANWTTHVAPAAQAVPTYARAEPTYTAAPVAGATYAAYYGGDPFAAGSGTAGVPRKSRVGLYVGIGVGVFLIFAAMTVSAVVIFLQQKEAASPRGTFDHLVEAWQAKDCAAEYRVSLVSTEPGTTADYCDGVDYTWVDGYQDWTIDVTSVDELSDTATVNTTETYHDLDTGEKAVETWSYNFELVAGTWYYVDASLVN